MKTETTESPGFEAALSRMEEIAARLERPDIALDEAMTLYEEGVRLSRECAERLRAAELRIEELRQESPGHDASPTTNE